ncbi:MAG: hypothetical protein KAW12_01945 [Candidatus Aminicenantes bacterium]|nr:hypothetical protein [Candidatus Aminicenantes bacterium]
MKSEVIETKGAKLWLEDGIFHSETHPNAEMDLGLAREHLKIHAKLTGGKKTPVLTDIRTIKSIDRDARRHLSGEEAEKIHTVLALLVTSPVSKVIGNFFMAINKPRFPSRMFNSEEKATAWLKSFLEQEEN